jgi:eukaryotic translation initiation factor 2C
MTRLAKLMKIATRLMEIPGRILPAPIPVYGKGTDSSGQQTGSWNLRGKKLFKPCGFSSWGFMHFGNRISEMQVLSTAKSLAQVLASVGLVTPACPPTIARGNPHGNMREQIHVLFRKAGKPGILFFLLEASPDIYRMIKLICEVELGVPSQVMSEKAFRSQGQVQYFSNIALKGTKSIGRPDLVGKRIADGESISQLQARRGELHCQGAAFQNR